MVDARLDEVTRNLIYNSSLMQAASGLGLDRVAPNPAHKRQVGLEDNPGDPD